MKKITIDGYTFEYETLIESSEFGDYYETHFYNGTVTKTYRKYWLFGPIITEEVPNHIFTICEDSENTNLSKEWWREKIREKINKHLIRRLELDLGELV
jgi:hypothetical protein